LYYLSFCPLYYLSFFNFWLLITPLISWNFSWLSQRMDLNRMT
jgi:hypothetical protein